MPRHRLRHVPEDARIAWPERRGPHASAERRGAPSYAQRSANQTRWKEQAWRRKRASSRNPRASPREAPTSRRRTSASRARTRPSRSGSLRCSSSVLPAHAGMIHGQHFAPQEDFGVPRTRGDDPPHGVSPTRSWGARLPFLSGREVLLCSQPHCDAVCDTMGILLRP